MLAALDLTKVLDTLIITLPAILAAVYAGRVHHQIKTPSGDPIGQVAERTHDMAAVGVAAVTGTNGPAVTNAVRKLNADPAAPVQVDPATLEEPRA